MFLSLTLKMPTLFHAKKSQTSTDKTWNMWWVAHKLIDGHYAIKKYIKKLQNYCYFV